MPGPTIVRIMRVAWLDVGSGVSGDMLLGAFADLGIELDVLQRSIDAVLPGTVRLEHSEVLRAGTRATKVDVRLLVDDKPRRSWVEIRARLYDADPPVRDRALAVLGRLAAVEGRIHGVDPDDVHFHEIGSWDSIADVVGVCAARRRARASPSWWRARSPSDPEAFAPRTARWRFRSLPCWGS